MMRVESDRASYYDDPLVYHVLHLHGTKAETRVFERLARRHATGAAAGPLRWLEPASGSGRYLHALARAGHSGVGVDRLAPMNAFATAEAERMGIGERLRFVTAPMEGFSVRRSAFDVAINPINSVRHLMTDRAMLGHLSCVRRALRRGGVYIVGVEVNPVGMAQPCEDVWKGRVAGLSVHQFVSYIPPEGRSRRETALSHKTVLIGRGAQRTERHIDSVYHLRTYTKPQWQRLLAEAGWEVVACYGPTGRAKAFEPIGYSLQVLRPLST